VGGEGEGALYNLLRSTYVMHLIYVSKILFRSNAKYIKLVF